MHSTIIAQYVAHINMLDISAIIYYQRNLQAAKTNKLEWLYLPKRNLQPLLLLIMLLYLFMYCYAGALSFVS